MATLITINGIAKVLTIGQVFNCFYGNGEACGQEVVTRMSDKSVWTSRVNGGEMEFRKSIKSFGESIERGTYVAIETPATPEPTEAAPVAPVAPETPAADAPAGFSIDANGILIIPAPVVETPAGIITDLQMPVRTRESKLATQLQSDLAWDVVIEPIQTASGIILPGYKSLTRSDNGGVLNVAKETYTPTMNSRFKDVANQLAEITGFSIAGYDEFRNGKQIFGYLKAEENSNMFGWEHEQYMVIGNSHDGKTGFFVGTTSVMIRCMNQFSAINQKLKVYHTKSNDVKIEELLAYFRGYQVERNIVEKQMEKFQSIKVSDKILVSLTEKLFNIDSKKEEAAGKKEDAKINTRRQNLLNTFNEQLAIETNDLGKNLFGFFHGVTRYATHSVVTEKTFGNIAGIGLDLNKKAFELCEAYAAKH